jgi:hypothetical protein
MLRGVSGFSIFTSRGSDFGSSGGGKKKKKKILINANVMLHHYFYTQVYCGNSDFLGVYEH